MTLKKKLPKNIKPQINSRPNKKQQGTWHHFSSKLGGFFIASLILVTSAGGPTLFENFEENGPDGIPNRPAALQVTDTPMETPSETPTPSDTATASSTPTASFTASETLTPSDTPTASVTATDTLTPSITPTPSDTPTSSYTPTPSKTPTNTLTPTPVPVIGAQWHFDEGSGNTAFDSVNDHDGTITGATWNNYGILGSALEFSGSGQYVNVPYVIGNYDLMPSNSFSVAAWINPTTLGNGMQRTILMYGSDTYVLRMDASGYLQFQMSNLGNPNPVLIGPIPSLNSWTYVVATYDWPTKQIELFVNGQLVTVKSFSSQASAPYNALRIGSNSSGGEAWQGRIDEVAIYSRALQQSDIQNQYENAIETITPTPTITVGTLLDGLISFWELEEASGIRDDSYGLNNLADNSTVLNVNGRVGSAGDFNRASSEYLSVADNAELSLDNSDFTLTAWVYLDNLAADGGIVSKSSTTTSSNQEYSLFYQSSTNEFVFRITTSTGTVVSVNRAVPNGISAGQWYFLIAYFDGDEQMCLTPQGFGVTTCNIFITPPISVKDSTNTFAIGRTTTSANRYWDGRIDQVGIWGRLLTSTEKTALYNNGQGLSYQAMASIAVPTSTPTPTSPPSPTATIVPSTLLNCLVAYWHFDEEVGTRYDAVANPQFCTTATPAPTSIPSDLIDTSTVEQDEGVLGWAADFSYSSSEYLSITDNETISVVSDQSKSWAGWFKIESFTGDNQALLGKWTSSSSRYEYLIRVDNASKQLVFYVRNQNNTASISVTATNQGVLNIGQWYFAYAYYDRQTGVIGVSVNGGPPNTASNPNGIHNDSAKLYFGRYYDGDFFDGQVDEWGIWNRVLTQEEVGALYNGGLGLYYPFDGTVAPTPTPTPEPGVSIINDLVAYWKLDEASGIREDAFGSNELVDHNTVSQAEGMTGFSADFDSAASEYLSVADNPAVSVAIDQSKSWAGWFKIEDLGTSYLTLLGKWQTTNQYDYLLRISQATHQLVFYVRKPDDSASVSVTNPLVLEAGQWYFAYAYHDEHEDQIGLSINAGQPTSTGYSYNVNDGTSPLYLGRQQSAGYNFDGQMDEWGIWDRVLTDEEVAYLYNGGLGQSYPFDAQGIFGPPSETLLQGLAAYWHLEEEIGTRFDVLQTSNLTDNNTVQRLEGLNGYAADIEANYNESLTAPDNAVFSVAGHQSKSWAGWVRIETLGMYAPYMYLFEKQGANGTEYYSALNYSSDTYQIQFVAQKADNSGVGANLIIPAPLNLGEWVFIYIFHDEHEDQLGISVNGQPPVSIPYNFGIRDGSNPIIFGRIFDGQLDEWGIWDRVLTPGEIAALYNNGEGLAYPFDGTGPALLAPSPIPPVYESLSDQLVAYWPLNEETGDRSDLIGGNSNLSETNTVGAGNGIVGNSAHFESSNGEYLSRPDNEELSGSGFADKSWAGWIRVDTAISMQAINKTSEYTFGTSLWNGNLRFAFSALSSSAGVPNVGTSEWYFIYLHYDSRNGEIGISVNNGPSIVYEDTDGISDGSGLFYLGANGFDGDLDEWGVWSRLLRPDEIEFLYNNGAGRTYPFANPNPPEGIWIEWDYSYGSSPVHGVTSVEQSGQ
jgi:hypothetical protein